MVYKSNLSETNASGPCRVLLQGLGTRVLLNVKTKYVDIRVALFK